MAWRRLFTYSGAALLAAAAVASVVPADRVVVRPLDPQDAGDYVRLPGARKAADSRIYFPVVDGHRARWIEVLVYSALGGAELKPLGTEIVDDTEHGGIPGTDLLQMSQQVATLLAARQLDIPVKVSGEGVRVYAVGRNPEKSPLQAGDVIVQVNGRRVRTYADLVEVLDAAAPATRPRVLLADGRTVVVPPIPRDIRRHGRLRTPVALNVAAVETENLQVLQPRLDWDAPDRTGGPSAGLAYALEAYHLLGGTLLTRKKVFASAEVGSDGGVYAVGGIESKARSAADHDADYLMVSSANENAARKAAGGVEVIGVDSFAEAVSALARAD